MKENDLFKNSSSILAFFKVNQIDMISLIGISSISIYLDESWYTENYHICINKNRYAIEFYKTEGNFVLFVDQEKLQTVIVSLDNNQFDSI